MDVGVAKRTHSKAKRPTGLRMRGDILTWMYRPPLTLSGLVPQGPATNKPFHLSSACLRVQPTNAGVLVAGTTFSLKVEHIHIGPITGRAMQNLGQR